jgi:predicted transposase YdaD
VERVWQRAVEDVLAGGLGTLPLAPLCNTQVSELPRVIEAMKHRIVQEANQSEAATLWTATYVLMGLRYPGELSDSLLKGVREMRESVTYQAILEEGMKLGEPAARLQEARSLLLRVGTKRFGAPDAAMRDALASIVSVERAEQLIERSLDVESWAELLQQN